MYQADVSNNWDNERRVYLGVSKTTFKEDMETIRESEHEIYCNTTELSKYVWELKRNNKDAIITWNIARKVYGNRKSNLCRLCLIKKFLMIKFPNQDTLLNKRSQFISKFRHENKLFIVNMK